MERRDMEHIKRYCTENSCSFHDRKHMLCTLEILYMNEGKCVIETVINDKEQDYKIYQKNGIVKYF